MKKKLCTMRIFVSKTKKRLIFLSICAILIFACLSQAMAMSVPEARVWGRADDGWNTFDSNEQYSSTESLSYTYVGAYTGYSNHAYGGITQSLAASAYATTDGVTPNMNNAALAVPYLYFQWRVARNDGVNDNPLTQVPVNLNIEYLLDSNTVGLGGVNSDAYFIAGNVFGGLWFAPVATPSYPYIPGSYTFQDDSYVNNWNTVYMQLSAHAQSGNTGGAGEIDTQFIAAITLPSGLENTYHIEFNTVQEPIQPVPEPSTIILLGSILTGLAGFKSRNFLKINFKHWRILLRG